MEIKIPKAIKLFFPNPKFELVFFEAIANSMDAGASEIEIEISNDIERRSSSIELIITDNGEGFTDRNLDKFSKLLNVDTEDHKGLGRLVFLNYFEEVDITSSYQERTRHFSFNKNFSGYYTDQKNNAREQKTILHFKKYLKQISSYEVLSPKHLKTEIVHHFFPIFYEKKLKKEPLKITIRHEQNEYGCRTKDSEVFNVTSLEDLCAIEFPADGLDLFSNLKILYSIKKVEGKSTIITSICSDGRTIPLSLLNKAQLPAGYELIFVVFSDYFDGKSNNSRQSLNLSEHEHKRLKSMLIDKLSKIISDQIPEIKEHNQREIKDFSEKYPHLKGYINEIPVGFIDRSRVIEEAQKMFFSDQRDILEAQNMDDATYEKSLEMSSRLLTEYILYRTKMIKKLKAMNESHSEAEIHQAIVPMRKKLKGSNLQDQIFFNNAWLLDDKFMNFRSILSDCELKEIAKELEIEDNEFENKQRPDITIIFSSDINASAQKVDVVIVELKKKGADLHKKIEVITQLHQRARKLVRHYSSKIQRVWFYGIVDFDEEFKTVLFEEKFIELYSAGNLFYQEREVIPSSSDRAIRVPVGIFILDFDAFLNDAESRNKTFLEVLKSGFSDQQKNQDH